MNRTQSDRLESLAKFLNLMSEKLKDAESKTDIDEVVTELDGILLDSEIQQAMKELTSDE